MERDATTVAVGRIGWMARRGGVFCAWMRHETRHWHCDAEARGLLSLRLDAGAQPLRPTIHTPNVLRPLRLRTASRDPMQDVVVLHGEAFTVGWILLRAIAVQVADVQNRVLDAQGRFLGTGV